MLKCVPNNGEIAEIHQIWGISSKIQNHSQSRWGMGWPKIKISILDPVFEEISTRAIFCKKIEDFSKKKLAKFWSVKKKACFFSPTDPSGRDTFKGGLIPTVWYTYYII